MKAVLIYSGGMDSFTLLHDLIHQGNEVHAVSFNYGQRHSVELQKASATAKMLGIEHKVVDLRALAPLLQGGSALTTHEAVPEGHYAEENMRKTVVPNRNMIMLSIAAGWAVSIKATNVYFAAHSGDHDVYPDCRREFVDAVSYAADVGNWDEVNILAPYIELSKGTILARGKEIGLRAEDYLFTWTCYNGRNYACGKCGACVERLEGFHQVGWIDPLSYEDRDFYKAALGL